MLVSMGGSGDDLPSPACWPAAEGGVATLASVVEGGRVESSFCVQYEPAASSFRPESAVPTHTTRLPVEVPRPLSVRVLPPQGTLKAADIGVTDPRLGVCIGDGGCYIGVTSEPAAPQTRGI